MALKLSILAMVSAIYINVDSCIHLHRLYGSGLNCIQIHCAGWFFTDNNTTPTKLSGFVFGCCWFVANRTHKRTLQIILSRFRFIVILNKFSK